MRWNGGEGFTNQVIRWSAVSHHASWTGGARVANRAQFRRHLQYKVSANLWKSCGLSNSTTVGNVDATIVAEQPKLAPHIDAMRAALAKAIGCGVGDVGIQASTSEELGFVGREEGMVAWAIAAIEKI